MATILLVEDDEILRNMYRVKFTKAGHEVLMAENGQVGLEQMRAHKPDLVLMDMMMPVMDGFTALTQAKADPEIKDIKVIILTNLSQSEDIGRTKELGAEGYMVKSNLTPTEVLEQITPYLP